MKDEKNANAEQVGCCSGCGCLILAISILLVLAGYWGIVVLLWPIAYLFYSLDRVFTGSSGDGEKRRKREWWEP